jgi:acetyl-CoA carboxylase alpha subunit
MMENPRELVGMGVWHLQTAITVMNLLVNNQLVDLKLMDEMITEKIGESGHQNEQALWETYRDFLNPEINSAAEIPQNVIRFPEGEDFV